MRPIIVETVTAIKSAVGAPSESVNRTTMTAASAAFEPMERSISPAIMHKVKASPTRPRTANLSIIANDVL